MKTTSIFLALINSLMSGLILALTWKFHLALVTGDTEYYMFLYGAA